MEKITKISFMRKLKEFDSAMILSVSNESLEDVISDLDINHSIVFDRSATFSGSNVVFTFLKDCELNESHLDLSGTYVFLHDDFYIVVDKCENVEYILVYKISDKKTLNFEAIKQAKIDLELKENQDIELASLEKIKLENESYFSHKYFNKEKITKLTPIQLGRLKKALDKQFRFDGVVMTLKENLESLNISDKNITDKMSKWNRVKFNKLDNEEQNEYEAKLKAGKLYNICFDGHTREIAKIVFDVLVDDFSEITFETTIEFNDAEQANEFAIAYSRQTLRGHTVSKNKVSIYGITEDDKVWIDAYIAGINNLDNILENDPYNLLNDENSLVDATTTSKKEFESGSVVITKDNIHLYYEFMSDKDLEKYATILGFIFIRRIRKLFKLFKIDRYNVKQSLINNDNYLGVIYFGVKYTLKPLDEYIEEIKASSEYKEYSASLV